MNRRQFVKGTMLEAIAASARGEAKRVPRILLRS